MFDNCSIFINLSLPLINFFWPFSVESFSHLKRSKLFPVSDLDFRFEWSLSEIQILEGSIFDFFSFVGHKFGLHWHYKRKFQDLLENLLFYRPRSFRLTLMWYFYADRIFDTKNSPENSYHVIKMSLFLFFFVTNILRKIALKESRFYLNTPLRLTASND